MRFRQYVQYSTYRRRSVALPRAEIRLIKEIDIIVDFTTGTVLAQNTRLAALMPDAMWQIDMKCRSHSIRDTEHHFAIMFNFIQPCPPKLVN